ncbi:methyltransferase domain-containing protein [Candidatus Finniella inopinata]|uniref:Methyltransferase domain-containing protein n=1 Tax=Candidatus Finniella inopinata TaxID=1696036 RepID=A0A4Q7DIE3_9PROT|nr:methyltransferase domain-containing protein [Candidatus Finniella inopinata]RZI46130.1 methyltransferase domain-containing protein [Candidatus Finniella inopinata]
MLLSRLEIFKVEPHQLFDRALYKRRRQQLLKGSIYFKFAKEVSKRLQERLSGLQSDFQTVFQTGDDQHLLQQYLKAHKKTDFFVQEGASVHCDEEAFPFTPNSFDLILHVLNLHAVNDVPGVLTQALNCLKPDGFFLAAFIGDNSFQELKAVLETVELEHHDGFSQRISPWIRTRDAGSLLQRAGFGLPVVDCDRVVIYYPNLKMLLQDLKQSKETSFLMNRQAPPLTRSFLSKAEALYKERFWDEGQQGIRVSLDIVYMAGWRPAPNHQKSLQRGSAKHHLGDFLSF